MATSTLYQRQRAYLVSLRQIPNELQGTVAIDESYFGTRQAGAWSRQHLNELNPAGASLNDA
ncbi:hypothetical protein SAMN00120144_4008 [Hymenobacter roseosalivarius DSM 11622]|uniref:Transposase n=1 Tax=Hymenobacter roseosalivarius DSM 11622 TaxID=645990 RepID=A0A1W1UHK1_9BACT|nr:hypothetical protein [Hymenobacter roseosalivarius]SMB80557.1 hypothetical protein SAMN00120144_4008 [Hymenobacter roseosalivarius DSM 11622]